VDLNMKLMKIINGSNWTLIYSFMINVKLDITLHETSNWGTLNRVPLNMWEYYGFKIFPVISLETLVVAWASSQTLMILWEPSRWVIFGRSPLLCSGLISFYKKYIISRLLLTFL
jgi:hypothetical protein